MNIQETRNKQDMTCYAMIQRAAYYLQKLNPVVRSSTYHRLHILDFNVIGR